MFGEEYWEKFKLKMSNNIHQLDSAATVEVAMDSKLVVDKLLHKQ